MLPPVASPCHCPKSPSTPVVRAAVCLKPADFLLDFSSVSPQTTIPQIQVGAEKDQKVGLLTSNRCDGESIYVVRGLWVRA